MAHEYAFRIADVTCEKCDARLRTTLEGLPGVEGLQYARTPADEAEVVLTMAEPVAKETIERAVVATSEGTTHDYRVAWEG